MKKTYIAVVTLFIISTAFILTRISDVEENIITPQPEISVVENTTTTETIKKPIVAENPEGEDNGNIGPGIFDMDLDTKTWNWISTTYSDGKIIKPVKVDKFKLTFTPKNKSFSASTDCNGVGGEFTTNGQSITFDKMISTLMYCEGSQEAEFSKSLSQVSSYYFTNKGELVFDLKYDSGSMIFR